MTALVAHVRTGRWSTIMSKTFADMFDIPPAVCALPLVDPEVFHTIGLVVIERDPLTPLTAAPWAQAQRLAPRLEAGHA